MPICLDVMKIELLYDYMLVMVGCDEDRTAMILVSICHDLSFHLLICLVVTLLICLCGFLFTLFSYAYPMYFLHILYVVAFSFHMSLRLFRL
jgi:hypothetical protein